VGFNVFGREADDVKLSFAGVGINVSTMADWDAPIDFNRRGRSSVVRAAPHYFNSDSEIDRFIDHVRLIAQ
jgi:selenocysteine lyase/cysteine desulfurase